MSLLLVTGSKNKLEEWQKAIPSIQNIDIDLFERQSEDPLEVVLAKVKRAYKLTKQPVIVDDVSSGLDKHGGLPGPFIKFYIKKLGDECLLTLAGEEGASALITCAIAYYDGTTLITVRGDVHGTIVSARGEYGFGIDKTFKPNGYDQTFGEMTLEQKSSISHRAIAIAKLQEEFKKHDISF